MGHTGGPVTGSFLGSDADLQNGEKEKVCQWEAEGKGYPTVTIAALRGTNELNISPKHKITAENHRALEKMPQSFSTYKSVRKTKPTLDNKPWNTEL